MDASNPRGQHPWFSSAISDLNRDGTPDVVTVHSPQAANQATVVTRSGDDGDMLWSDSFDSPGRTWIHCPAVVADVDTTYRGAEVLTGRDTVRCYSSAGELCWRYDNRGVCAGLAVADLDGSHPPEVIALTSKGLGDTVSSQGTCGWLYVLDGSGSLIDSVGMPYHGRGEPAIADLNADGKWEIVVASSRMLEGLEERRWVSELRVFTLNAGTLEAELLSGRPLRFEGRAEGGPVIGDIDQDDKLEIWFADGRGLVHCLEFEPDGSPSRWPGHRHDLRNTGVYEHVMTGAYPESTSISWWGDYLLTGDVLVDSSSVLDIQPGTIVRAAPNQDDAPVQTDGLVGLIVGSGSVFRAEGTASDSIQFRAQGGSILPGQWRGITLQNGARRADFRRCRVLHGQTGVWSSGADTLFIERCSFKKNQIKGVRCNGNSGAANVLLRKNKIELSQVGVEMTGCAATVDSNQIYGCGSYGVRIYQDEGSTVQANEVNHAKSSPFSGIFCQGAADSVWILDNVLSEIRTHGIGYEMPQGSDEGLIRGNEITCSLTAAKGMYFYDASPKVRWNSISDAYVGFWIEDDGGVPPDLGDATVSDGNNSVSLVTRQPGGYYVRVIGSVQGDVPAENNYWQPVSGYSPDSTRFSFQVDWHPWLEKDPNHRAKQHADPEAPIGLLAFGLRQNHPNPFNPTTTLSFSITSEAHTTLRIYNAQGRLVREVVDDVLAPGRYEIAWNSLDETGARVSSGVYFCRLASGDDVARIRLVLLK
jgi:hypothetical protein